jgi:hypothetical protein
MHKTIAVTILMSSDLDSISAGILEYFGIRMPSSMGVALGWLYSAILVITMTANGRLLLDSADDFRDKSGLFSMPAPYWSVRLLNPRTEAVRQGAGSGVNLYAVKTSLRHVRQS